MPTPVTGRCNLHTADCYGQPLGVRCRSCERRALVPLDRIGAKSGDMRELEALPLKCSGCGARDVELWMFVKGGEADALAEHGPCLILATQARHSFAVLKEAFSFGFAARQTVRVVFFRKTSPLFCGS